MVGRPQKRSRSARRIDRKAPIMITTSTMTTMQKQEEKMIARNNSCGDENLSSSSSSSPYTQTLAGPSYTRKDYTRRSRHRHENVERVNRLGRGAGEFSTGKNYFSLFTTSHQPKIVQSAIRLKTARSSKIRSIIEMICGWIATPRSGDTARNRHRNYMYIHSS